MTRNLGFGLRAMTCAAFCLTLLLGGPRSARAADASKPHPHRGSVPHFEGKPPSVTLTRDEQVKLLSGYTVRKQVQRENGGRGVMVFPVSAPPEVVWSVISDFGKYPEWIDSLAETNVYKRDGDNIYVYFKISSWGVNVEYYIKHNYPMAKKGWGTWTLDYDRESDLDDSVGYWRVSSLAGDPTRSRVEYSVDLALRGWIPDFIKNILIDKGLEEATQWVKIQSEARYKKNPEIVQR